MVWYYDDAKYYDILHQKHNLLELKEESVQGIYDIGD